MKNMVASILALAGVALAVGVLVHTITNSTLDIRFAFALIAVGLPMLLLAPAVLAQARDAWKGLLPHWQWWHACWIMSYAGGIAFRSRDTDAIRAMPVDWWAGYRVALVCLVLLIIVSRIDLSRLSRSLTRGVLGLITLYTAICILSTLWSVYPLWTAYRSCEYLIDVAVLGAILTYPISIIEVKSIFDLTWAIYGLLLLTVWLGVVIWPTEALQTGIGSLGFQIQGVLPAISSNGIGDIAGWLTIIAVVRLLFPISPQPHKLLYTAVLLASALSLVLAQTRSALIATIAGVSVVLAVSRKFRLLTVVAMSTMFVVALTDAPAAALDYLMRNQNMDLVMSLSGRVDWWAVAWEKVLERPWLGHGAYAGGRFATLESIGKTSTSSVHNTYLEVLLGAGIVALIPLLLAIARVWSILLRSSRRATQSKFETLLTLEALGIATTIMIRSFFSVGIIWHTAMEFLVVLIYCEFLLRVHSVPLRVPHNVAASQPMYARYT